MSWGAQEADVPTQATKDPNSLHRSLSYAQARD